MTRFFIICVSLCVLGVSAVSYANSYEGEARSGVIERTGKDLRNFSMFDVDVVAPVSRVTTRLEYVSKPVLSLICSTIPSDGKGDWKGFFNAPKSEKAARLADAIKGVGMNTAQRLVADGFFNRKPRTWDEFRDVILSADRVYHIGLSNQVLVTYGRENAQNLGYYSAQTCREELTYQNVWEQVTDRVFSHNVTKHFHVEIEGANLLRGERETLTATFDGFADSLSISSGLNSYTVMRADQGGTVLYHLLATRILVTPANTLTVIPSNDGGEMALKVIDAAFDAETARESGTPIAIITIQKKRKLWFDQTIATIEKELSTASEATLIQTGVRPQSGADYYVKVQLKRVGSRFHNGNSSEKHESSAVKF